MARDYREYGLLIEGLKELGMTQTPDGAKWNEADFGEMQEMMDDL